MYRVRGADQNEYGPISAEVLRDWYRHRRLVASSLVQVDGAAEWKPLSTFPEFADLVSGPQPSPTIPLATAKAQVTSRMARSSLVLGILGFVTCGITAVIGLVLGIISNVKINRNPDKLKGKGLAISGIIVSSIAIVVMCAIGTIAPSIIRKSQAKSESVGCVINLKQICLAARMYSLDHDNVFPKDFLMMSNELVSPRVLICNADFGKFKAADWSRVGPRNISYEYLVPGRKAADVAETPAFRCPVHGHVILGDGTMRPATK